MKPGNIGPIFLALLLLAADGTHAQSADAKTGSTPSAEDPTDFEWIELSIGAGAIGTIGGYDGWSTSPAPFLIASTPYLGGQAELGAEGRTWSADTADLPDFSALFVFVGWAPDWTVSDRIDMQAGLRAGNHLMIFRTDQVVGQRVESEFAVQPHAGANVRVTGRMLFSVDAGFLRVFTAPRLDDVSIRAGLSWRLDAPPGLRRFLQ